MFALDTFNKKEQLLQLPTKCSCNNLQKCFATFCKKVLQKTKLKIHDMSHQTGRHIVSCNKRRLSFVLDKCTTVDVLHQQHLICVMLDVQKMN